MKEENTTQQQYIHELEQSIEETKEYITYLEESQRTYAHKWKRLVTVAKK